MADAPDIEEEFDEEDLEVEVELDDEDLAEDLDESLDDEFVEEVDVVDEDAEADEAEVVAKPRKGEEDDDDEEVADSDDVEADLSVILKDRIAAADDEEEEEEVDVPDTRPGEGIDGVTPKRADEFMCTGCFLLVNRAQFGPPDSMECPMGEADCPAITRLKRGSRKK